MAQTAFFKAILKFCTINEILFIFVVLGSYFGFAVGLVSGTATKAAIAFSIFSFTNCYGYVYMLIFILNSKFNCNAVESIDINTITGSISA